MDQITVRKGSIIHVEGLPFELAQDTLVFGKRENLALLIERTQPTAWVTVPEPRCPQCGGTVEHVVDAPSADNKKRQVGQCPACGSVELEKKGE